MASAVEGRWVATGGVSSCFPCRIPITDLTVSWSNTQFGTRSTKLICTPPGQWNSACFHQILYSLSCAGGQIQFVATHFPNTNCQGGARSQLRFARSQPVCSDVDRLYVRSVLLAIQCHKQELPGDLQCWLQLVHEHRMSEDV
jgi:hypothetical protein